ncbi:hypothetical protein [uncultured Muribaculum sp.]|uniref:hypothetical protein n=1 Tax=uncultured Muribaculum sp. TaxID=1918613 RepID=UPI0027314F3B|nr:hypothetical protein [uncultured Muribaculum sp.]
MKNYFSKVFTMLDNKVYSFDVEKIDIYISPINHGDKLSPMKITVDYYDYMCRNRFDEKDCYATKEELLASL